MDTKAAFEKWWKEAGHEEACAGSLLGQTIKMVAEQAFSKSRDVIEIEFPNLSEDKFCWSDGVFNLKEDISNMLTSHGIRIKGKAE